ncbi:MAG: peptide chain release factor 2 [Desulfohalobiaceae bacterium]
MLQYSELKREAADLLEQFRSLWGRLDLDKARHRYQEIERKLSAPGAWEEPDQLKPVLQEKSRIADRIEQWEKLDKARQELEEWLELAGEDQGGEVLAAVQDAIDKLSSLLERVEMKLLLSDPQDKYNAILEIHPGAGGTEAQDWAEMLLRMYRRWCEREELSCQILDYLPGEEAGLKSVTLQIEGPSAYGLLKGEKGIHRLIRISPFDSSGRRHTSFASVDVYPDVAHDINIEVKEEDVRIDVFRSSGPGGQSVNKTSSAVRLTHLPTGIVVSCQNEKSQHRNKDMAYKILKARLYEAELEKVAAERQADYASKDAIAWGSQIRTYTLQPYRLVKDHRTNTEIGDVDRVLDGAIDTFIRNYLLYLHGRKSQ